MGEGPCSGSSGAGAGAGACRSLQGSVLGGATTRRHAQVPTECALCGAAEFSSVVEVGIDSSLLLHWVSPPAGWYLLREARPERGAPLLHGRCPECMARLFAPQPEQL